jgi:hypothetical protein
MKLILIIISVSLCNAVRAQQLTLLSMDAFVGNDYEFVPRQPIKTVDGGFVLPIQSGSATGNLNTTCTLLSKRMVFNKYSADGTTLQWQKCIPYNGDSGFVHMFPQADGGFVIGGVTKGNGNPTDIVIKKINASDNVVWYKKYGGSSSEFLSDMVATEDGGYLLLCTSASGDGDVGFHYGTFNMDFWVVKIDSMGNKVWSTVLGGTAEETGHTIISQKNGGSYIFGWTTSTDYDCIGNHGISDALLIRLDDTGGKRWSRCLGGSSYEASQGGRAIDDGKGGVLIATQTISSDGDVTNSLGGNDFWVVNLDSANNLLWNKNYGSALHEMATTLCRSDDNTLWIGGGTTNKGGQIDTSFGGGDAWVIHTDSQGTILSTKILGAAFHDQISILYPLTDGSVLAGGFYYASGPSGGEFPSVWQGLSDVFLSRLAPWTTKIDDLDDNEFLNVYPNPVRKTLKIDSKKRGYVYSVKMVNSRGTVQYEKEKVVEDLSLDVRHWVSGLYHLYLVDRFGKSFYRKILVN